jgi:hypothetical protein
MIGQTSRHIRRLQRLALHGSICATTAPYSQTALEGAKVVNRTDQVHALRQGRHPARQRSAAAHPLTVPRPESRAEPLDVGGVDPALACRLFDHALYRPSPHLGQSVVEPRWRGAYGLITCARYSPPRRLQTTTAGLVVSRQRIAKDQLDGTHIGREPVHADQQGPRQSTRADLAHQGHNTCPNRRCGSAPDRVAAKSRHPTTSASRPAAPGPARPSAPAA